MAEEPLVLKQDEETEQTGLETELHNVAVSLVGEEDLLPNLLGKRRSDEEDFWPEPTNDREPVTKAQDKQQSETDEETYSPEILEPPLPLSSLVTAFEESNSLRQNVDAMVTNVDGFGFALEPVIPLDSSEMSSIVSDRLEVLGLDNSEESVLAEIKKIRIEAIREKRRLQQFFAFSADESFIELRRSSREDVEVLGNFGWEVLRNEENEIKRFVHVPFYTMRLTKKGDPIKITTKRKIDPITYNEADESKRFRKYIQRSGNKIIWFKEFGDPRPMSKKSGTYYKTEQEILTLAEFDESEGIASEFLHYKIRAIRGAYGLPRWIGNLLSVRGSRLSEEVNFFYFNNKAIPPMIIFVENGKLQSGAADRLSDFMKQVKGDTQKFWKIAIVEGEGGDDARKRGVTWSGQPRFKVVKLSSEQLKDALFQEYDANNRDKVGESFRMPRLLRGDVRDFNRATAETAKAFAEEQVFQPERDRFDAWVDRVIGPVLDMKYWRFKTLAPVVRDPSTLTDMVEKLVGVNVLTPSEGRKISEDIFNREFDEIDEPWTKQPMALTLAEIKTSSSEDTNDSAFLTKSIDPLGIGLLGDSIDVQATARRLLEIYHGLSRNNMLPSSEREGREDPTGN